VLEFSGRWKNIFEPLFIETKSGERHVCAIRKLDHNQQITIIKDLQNVPINLVQGLGRFEEDRSLPALPSGPQFKRGFDCCSPTV
jgi:hypothetical protein